MSMDNRGDEEALWLAQELGREQVFAVTGLPVHRKYGLSRMLWYQRHRPDLWARTWKCLTWEEFIYLRLGVEPVSDRSAVARLMVMDIRSGRLADEFLAAAGVSAEKIAAYVPAGTPIGTVAPAVGADLGFTGPVTVVTGGFDQSMACLGAGTTEPGDAMVGTGTMEALCVVADRPVLNPELLRGGYPWNIHVAPDRFICTATNVGGGLVLRWFRDTFGQEAVQEAARTGRSAYDVLLDDAPPGPTDLLLLPHLAGSGPPYKDADSLGALLGITATTTRGEIVQAVLEGITYELRQNIDTMAAAGVRVAQLRAVGGGARSARWAQLKADVTGLPVLRPRMEEAGCLAAAILAGCGTGVYRSVAEAAGALVQIHDRFDPDPARHAAYTKRYDLYRGIYPALKETFHGLRSL
jgi:xylulokinase